MAVVEVKVVPVGTESTSFSSVVTSCFKVVENEGVKHTLTPTSTIIEGDLDRVLGVVKKMHETALREGAPRVFTNISIDDRRDKNQSIESLVQSVATHV